MITSMMPSSLSFHSTPLPSLPFPFIYCHCFSCLFIVFCREFFLEIFGISSFYNIRVPHIADSYGLIFQSVNGWKFVFSGDTSYVSSPLSLLSIKRKKEEEEEEEDLNSTCRPCERLAEEGKGATVMIHEATMENALQHEAVGRGHSSTRDAIGILHFMSLFLLLSFLFDFCFMFVHLSIPPSSLLLHSLITEDIGNKMECYRTILTHFSARHHVSFLFVFLLLFFDIFSSFSLLLLSISFHLLSFLLIFVFQHFPVPDFVQQPLNYNNSMVAFDLMTVNLKHLPLLPLLVSPLVQMYKEDIAKR